MCDNVIVHKKDGSEITCEGQKELMDAMVNGLCFEPPVSPALRWRFLEENGLEYHTNEKHLFKKKSATYPFSFIATRQIPNSLHDPIGDLEYGYYA